MCKRFAFPVWFGSNRNFGVRLLFEFNFTRQRQKRKIKHSLKCTNKSCRKTFIWFMLSLMWCNKSNQWSIHLTHVCDTFNIDVLVCSRMQRFTFPIIWFSSGLVYPCVLLNPAFSRTVLLWQLLWQLGSALRGTRKAPPVFRGKSDVGWQEVLRLSETQRNF